MRISLLTYIRSLLYLILRLFSKVASFKYIKEPVNAWIRIFKKRPRNTVHAHSHTHVHTHAYTYTTTYNTHTYTYIHAYTQTLTHNYPLHLFHCLPLQEIFCHMNQSPTTVNHTQYMNHVITTSIHILSNN